jgi:hypothetical protein
LLQILAPVGLVQSVGSTVGHIYVAKGRTDLLFKWGLGASTLMTVGFAIGLWWNITGVAVSYVIVNALLCYPLFRIPLGLIGLPVAAFARALIPYLVATALMTTVVVVLKILLAAHGVQPLPMLIGTVSAGIVVYIAVGWLMKLSAIGDIAEIVGLDAVTKRFTT